MIPNEWLVSGAVNLESLRNVISKVEMTEMDLNKNKLSTIVQNSK